jgi:DNA-binding MarR family transcriptional regulator
VPQIARRIGLTRQSVHATVKRLVRGGLLEFVSNADHRRSQLVRLTEHGTATYSVMDQRQAAWVNRLADGIDRSDLETTAYVLDELCRRLETGGPEEERIHAIARSISPKRPRASVARAERGD